MKRPVIAFRTNGSAIIGLGHLRRCMALAQQLREQEAETRFVVNEEPGLLKFLREHGFEVVGVDEGDTSDLSQTLKHLHQWAARALVVDSYEVSGECLSQVRGLAVVVIDDLADRPLSVDLVINGGANARTLPYRMSPAARGVRGRAQAVDPGPRRTSYDLGRRGGPARPHVPAHGLDAGSAGPCGSRCGRWPVFQRRVRARDRTSDCRKPHAETAPRSGCDP